MTILGRAGMWTDSLCPAIQWNAGNLISVLQFSIKGIVQGYTRLLTIFTFPIIHFVCPPNFAYTIEFKHSWEYAVSQEHLKTMVYAKFGGQTKCIMGNVKMVNMELYTTTLSRRQLADQVAWGLLVRDCETSSSVWLFLYIKLCAWYQQIAKVAKKSTYIMDHFRLHVCLIFKASLSAKFFLWKFVFIHM